MFLWNLVGTLPDKSQQQVAIRLLAFDTWLSRPGCCCCSDRQQFTAQVVDGFSNVIQEHEIEPRRIEEIEEIEAGDGEGEGRRFVLRPVTRGTCNALAAFHPATARGQHNMDTHGIFQSHIFLKPREHA